MPHSTPHNFGAYPFGILFRLTFLQVWEIQDGPHSGKLKARFREFSTTELGRRHRVQLDYIRREIERMKGAAASLWATTENSQVSSANMSATAWPCAAGRTSPEAKADAGGRAQ
jgi:hypothetical protein